MKTVLGLVLIAFSSFMIIKTEWFLQNFGRLRWFEEKLGADGGSRLGYKIIGAVILFLGIILATGISDDFFQWLLKPLINAGQNN